MTLGQSGNSHLIDEMDNLSFKSTAGFHSMRSGCLGNVDGCDVAVPFLVTVIQRRTLEFCFLPVNPRISPPAFCKLGLLGMVFSTVAPKEAVLSL